MHCLAATDILDSKFLLALTSGFLASPGNNSRGSWQTHRTTGIVNQIKRQEQVLLRLSSYCIQCKYLDIFVLTVFSTLKKKQREMTTNSCMLFLVIFFVVFYLKREYVYIHLQIF